MIEAPPYPYYPNRFTTVSASTTQKACLEPPGERQNNISVKSALVPRGSDRRLSPSHASPPLADLSPLSIHLSRAQAARVPRLAATVDRLQRDKGAVESALGEEGRKVEEEQRRSKAWRAQADKASLQVTCRVEGQAIGLLVGLVHLRPAPGRGIIGSVWWVSA